MKLTQEERQMIESMRLAEGSKTAEVDQYRNVRAGFNSSLEGMIVAGLNSPHQEVKEQARELQTQMRTKMAEQGVTTVGALDFSEAEYNYLISQASEATKIDSNLSKEYGLIAETASMYNDPSVTDEVYSEITKLKLEETASKNSDDGMPYDVIRNEQTGTEFRKDRASGELSPHLDAMEEYESASASSDNRFLQSGGEQQGFFDGLVDK